MNSFNVSLRLINNGEGVPVPIEVKDQYSLFSTASEMSCIISGLATTPILWEQISGDAVTFTSPLTVNPVTFTSASLSAKVFRCYTNFGTSYQRFDDGTFFHFPLEYFPPDPNMFHSGGSIPSIASTSVALMADRAIGNLGYEGTPVSPAIYKVGRMRIVTSSEDIYTEYKVIGDSVGIINGTYKTEFMFLDNGTWTVLETHNKFVDTFIGYPALEGKDKKVVYSVYSYGQQGTVEATFQDLATTAINGVEYVGKPTSKLRGGLANYKASLSFYSVLSYTDTQKMYGKPLSSGGINYGEDHSSYSVLTRQETQKVLPFNLNSSVHDFDYVLQTSTGVT